ncbi:PREDICTED: tyrosyl-DNA phosphodiesterase 1-like [Priapulus caudatus]|uniref:Tyrosyl-DNA phosphodiesterase 1-like n=1 Tax=Priapulus caudatus TaxID=37621 RepID=A0ABM1F3H7_PRICU|nr:PREDICTED: tyrosyl-DNA phosphodiesterase 1-like [Priapulus caudatus]
MAENHSEVKSSIRAHPISESESDDEASTPGGVTSTSDMKTAASHVGRAPTTSTKRPATDAAALPGGKDARPACEYGAACYRKNLQHRREFSHPPGGAGVDVAERPTAKRARRDSPPPSRCPVAPPRDVEAVVAAAQPYGFLLSRVAGVSDDGGAPSLHISEILAAGGDVVASAQFSYAIDVPWLVRQYPNAARRRPLLVVHGEQREARAALHESAADHPHVSFVQARLDIPYGTHHTKLMLLRYRDDAMRVVVHTANLVEADWHQKTQGVWMSPLFPRLPEGAAAGPTGGDSATRFKRDLLEYLGGYRSPGLREWIATIEQHDMSAARVHIVASLPGRHLAAKRESFGHMKLRRLLRERVPRPPEGAGAGVVVAQFSSIGSLGATRGSWLGGEWLTSVAATRGDAAPAPSPALKLVFPCVEDVRTSLEGYAAGGALPYSVKTAAKQPWMHNLFHRWRADGRGRTRASPHVKTYARAAAADCGALSWFVVTSANLSKAAWGALEKNNAQLAIRSYELGVLFVPEDFGESELRVLPPGGASAADGFPVPYDLPPTRYAREDRPWMWDVPHDEKPDARGVKWCPSPL